MCKAGREVPRRLPAIIAEKGVMTQGAEFTYMPRTSFLFYFWKSSPVFFP